MSIDLATYTPLSQYAILAGAGITFDATSGNTSVKNGYYGSFPTQTYTGTPTVLGTPSGQNNADASVAQTQLTTFISNILIYASFLASSSIGTFTGPGSITFLPNIHYNSASAITFTTYTVNFDAQGDPNAQFFITAGSAIAFTNVTINLLNGAKSCNIFLVAGSAITFSGTPTVFGTLLAGTTITFTGTTSISGHVYAQTASATFTGGATLLDATLCTGGNGENVVCYAKGTLILTKNGFVPIEYLKAGHQIVSKGEIYKNKFINTNDKYQLKPIVWVSKFKVNNMSSKTKPICIKKNTFGNNTPVVDLFVSPQHSLLIDGKMILAKNMINEETIFQDNDCETVEYYHIELETHSAIIANGVLSESYLDVNNRDIFENSVKLKRVVPKHELNRFKYTLA